MILIGERINSSRKIIQQAIKNFDKDIIINEIKLQTAIPVVDMIDVNCGTEVKNEADIMKWLIEVIQMYTSLPLVIDSPEPKTIQAAINICKNVGMINSITAEDERLETIVPIAKQYNTKLVALTIDKNFVPTTVDERMKIVDKIVNRCISLGFNIENLYIDPLVKPVSVEQQQAIEVVKTIQVLKSHNLKSICAISNISFGLPKRWFVNRAYTVLCCWYGLDAAFIDPADKELLMYVKISEMLNNKDEYCLSYIDFVRQFFS